jgi:hypothetical protein
LRAKDESRDPSALAKAARSCAYTLAALNPDGARERIMSTPFDAICELEFTNAVTGSKVTARLGRPIFDQSRDMWYCLTEVAGLELGRVGPAYGVNQFQAVIMGLSRLGHILEAEGGNFLTAMGDRPYMIFPKFIPFAYGSDVYQPLSKLVQDEVQEIEDAMTSRREAYDRNRKDNSN